MLYIKGGQQEKHREPHRRMQNTKVSKHKINRLSINIDNIIYKG